MPRPSAFIVPTANTTGGLIMFGSLMEASIAGWVRMRRTRGFSRNRDRVYTRTRSRSVAGSGSEGMNSRHSLRTRNGAWLGCARITSTSWRWSNAPVFPSTVFVPSSHRVRVNTAFTASGSSSWISHPLAERAASRTSTSV